MSKQRTYRQRLRSQGRCTRCGDPSLLYHDCQKCRTYKNIHRVVRKWIKDGLVWKDKKGRIHGIEKVEFSNKKSNPVWSMPRFGYKPLTSEMLGEVIISVLERNGKFMTTEDILKDLPKQKMIMSSLITSGKGR